MPLFKYGVLKGKVVDVRPVDSYDKTPHYEVHIRATKKDKSEENYRIAINVASKVKPSEVLYFVSEDFNSNQITIIPQYEEGFTEVTNENREIALDYIRGGLFDSKKMIPLPATKNGPDNDLKEVWLEESEYMPVRGRLSKGKIHCSCRMCRYEQYHSIPKAKHKAKLKAMQQEIDDYVYFPFSMSHILTNSNEMRNISH